LIAPGRLKYLRNSGWLIAPRLFKATFGTLVAIFVARHLGPTDLGTLSFVASLVALFTGLAKLGLDNVLVRDLVKTTHRSYKAVLLGTALLMRSSLSIAIAILLSTVFFQLSPSDTAKVILVFHVFALVVQSPEVIYAHFQATLNAQFIAYCEIAGTIVNLLVSLLFLAAGASVIWFGAVTPIVALVETALLLHFYKRAGNSFSMWRFRADTARNLLADSWPLILSGVAVNLYMKVDQVIIAQLIDERAVGLYAVAVRLSEGWSFIPAAVISSVFPAVVRMGQSNDPKYWRRVQQLYDLMVIMGVSVAIPVTLFAHEIIHFLYGAAYAESANALAISTWATLFIALGGANMRVLLSEGRTRQSFIRTGAGATLNIALNYILIPSFGIVGASVATVISYALAAYISIPWFHGQRRHFQLATSSLLVVPALYRFACTGTSILRRDQ
jgi:O-antigen/teichoic acid export membrane protein